MRSIRATSSLLAACALALAVLLPGCKPKPKPAPPAPAPAAKAEPDILPAQLYGLWQINSVEGGSVDQTVVQSQELEFTADSVRASFVSGKGVGVGGAYRWRVSGSSLVVTLSESSGLTSSSRISLDGDYLVIHPPNPFPAPADFQAATVAYKRVQPGR
jgi:hypothetical protein